MSVISEYNNLRGSAIGFQTEKHDASLAAGFNCSMLQHHEPGLDDRYDGNLPATSVAPLGCKSGVPTPVFQELKTSSRILFAMVILLRLRHVSASPADVSFRIVEHVSLVLLAGGIWLGCRMYHDAKYVGTDFLACVPGYCYRRMFCNPPNLGSYPLFDRVLLEVFRDPSNVKSGLVVTTWNNKLHIAYPGPGDPGGPIGSMRKGKLSPDPTFVHLVGPPSNWTIPKVYLDRPVGGYWLKWLSVILSFLFTIGPVGYCVGGDTLVDMISDAFYGLYIYCSCMFGLPRFRVFTFGTRGDVTPMKYYTNLLQRAGIDCDQYDCLTPEQGLTALAHVENFEFYKSSRYLPELVGPLRDWVKTDDCVAIAPLGGVGHLRNVVTFDLAPPPSQLCQFRLLSSENMIGRVFNLITTLITSVNCPDFRVGSFRGCAPRSCNGETLLKVGSNKRKRKYLIAMGSSSNADVFLPDVDPLDIWSTRSTSVYQHEPRTDHAEMMLDYEHVICHGGAGTMATAASCGCLVSSADRFLDRDYVSDPDFVFLSNHFWFWYGILKPLAIHQRLFLIYKVFTLDPCVLFAVVFYQMTEISRFGFVMYVLFNWLWQAMPDLLASRTVPEMVTVLTAAGFSFDISWFWRFIILVCVAYGYRKMRFRDAFQFTSGMTVVFFRGLWKVSTSTTWAFLLGCLGPLPTVALVCGYDYVCRYWWADIIHYFTMGLIDTVDPWCDHDDRIMMRFSSLDQSWLPFLHVDFTDGVYYTGIGVSLAEGSPRCKVYVRDKPKTKTLFCIPTALPKSRWDQLVYQVSKFEGLPYTGIRNCQTAALSIRADGQYGGDVVILGFLTGMTVFSVLALVVPFAILAFCGLTCLAGPTIFALGGPDTIPTWMNILSLVFVPSMEVSNEATELYEVVNETTAKGYLKPKSVPARVCTPVEMSLFDDLESPCCFISNEDDRREAELRFAHVYHVSKVPNLITSGHLMDDHEHEYLVAGLKPSWCVVDLMLAYEGSDCVTFTQKGCCHTWGSITLKRGCGPGKVDTCFAIDNDQLFSKASEDHCNVSVVLLTCSPAPVPFSQFVWDEPGVQGLTKALSLAEPVKPWSVVYQKEDGCYYGDKPVDLLPLVSGMYGCGNTVTSLRQTLVFNRDAFFVRLMKFAERLETMILLGSASIRDCAVLSGIEHLLEVFDYGKRSPKGAWAPAQKPLRGLRAEELGVVIHSSPKFHDVNYQKTLDYYVHNLELFGKRDLNIHHFIRRVNRNPHVDLLLQQRGLDHGGVEGIDAIVLACKETMVTSLASYSHTRTADALLDDDIMAVADTIVNQNSALYLNANLADPRKLVSHFMKHKKYSAGLPFIGAGLKKRDDLRKHKWLAPIAKMATLPFESGEWFPSIAHAFPKSQVVPTEKLRQNPSKLRSVVASSLVTNVQQGVLNFDTNNRHAPHDGSGKAGITLNGAALGSVFSEATRYKNIISLDATAFDRNLNDNVFRILGEIRKRGYRERPEYDVIAQHIDQATLQEQRGHIVNLIADLWDDIELDPGQGDDLWKFVENFRDEYQDVTKKVAVEHATAPGGVIPKRGGGTTGSSNVTWQNTVGYEGTIIYSISKAQGWPIREFFDRVYLSNMSDDNIIATDFDIDWDKVFAISEQKFGVTLRVESTGNDVFTQTFLGKYPRPGTEFQSDFNMAGLDVPEFAVLHEKSKLLMRYSNFKADASRNMGSAPKKREYLIQKGIGYLTLCAHQPEIYKLIRTQVDAEFEKMPSALRKKARKKYPVPDYCKVVTDWYKAGTLAERGVVKSLQFTIGGFARTEQVLLRTLRMVRSIEQYLPTHLLTVDSDDVLDRVTEIESYGLFEAHIFHCYVKSFDRAPTEEELAYMCRMSPYASLCDVRTWYKNIGRFLPVTGPLFDRNLNYAVLHFWVYTLVYVSVNPALQMAQYFPFGSVALELLNVYLFTSRDVFSTWNYWYYASRGASSKAMSVLVPKDPYRGHKRAAYQIAEHIKLPVVMSLLPTWALNDLVSSGLDHVASWLNKSMFMDRTETLNGKSQVEQNTPPAWVATVDSIAGNLRNSRSVICHAHTGTGKTRYVPPLLAARFPEKRVCVVMPRRLLCSEFSNYPGVSWWRRGMEPTTRTFTCTYGHLNAKHMGGLKGYEDVIWVLDEGHEIACEIQMLFETMFSVSPCVLLTATPKQWMYKTSWDIIDAKVPPLHEIVDHRRDGKLDDLVEEALRSGFKRVLVIHHSAKFAKRFADKNRDRGFTALWSGNRTVPETGHIVASTIAEAGLTIPGCDLVIDCGNRVVNDQGKIVVVPVDKASSLQRRGRTGRTNPGEYWLMTDIVNKDYKPSPDIVSVLSHSSLALHFKTEIDLEPCDDRPIFGDYYGRCKPIKNKNLLASYSFYSKLIHMETEAGMAVRDYKQARQGKLNEQLEFYLELCQVDYLVDLAVVLREWDQNPVTYIPKLQDQDDTEQLCSTTLEIRKNVLRLAY